LCAATNGQKKIYQKLYMPEMQKEKINANQQNIPRRLYRISKATTR